MTVKAATIIAGRELDKNQFRFRLGAPAEQQVDQIRLSGAIQRNAVLRGQLPNFVDDRLRRSCLPQTRGNGAAAVRRTLRAIGRKHGVT